MESSRTILDIFLNGYHLNWTEERSAKQSRGSITPCSCRDLPTGGCVVTVCAADEKGEWRARHVPTLALLRWLMGTGGSHRLSAGMERWLFIGTRSGSGSDASPRLRCKPTVFRNSFLKANLKIANQLCGFLVEFLREFLVNIHWDT